VDEDRAFRQYVDGALATFGIEADETERTVIAAVWGLYREPLLRLLATDLESVEPEAQVDPSRAPQS
jgi:hypothetical protein